jgi:hypothetical protein
MLKCRMQKRRSANKKLYLISRNYFLLILLFFLFFILGAFSSLIEHKGVSYVPRAIYKVQNFFLQNGPPELKKYSFIVSGSSRYEFKLDSQFKNLGQFQIAVDSKSNLYALERQTGELWYFEDSNLSKGKLIRNIYQDMTLTASQHINSPPLAMDLHWAFNKLFLSVVVETKKCQYLSLIYLTTTLQENTPEKFFDTPCVTDFQNTIMWGGRFTSNTEKLFISIGEQRFDRSGFPKVNLSIINKLPINVFGTTLEFDPTLKSWEVYATGMRNAQGLFWDFDNKLLFEAEHGPSGGDEVNILEKGKNYGWPMETYGKPYNAKFPSGKAELNDAKDPRIWVDNELAKFGAKSGDHQKFSKPLFSWIPGVGAGNLVRVSQESPLIDWRGDLLVAHMSGQALHRLKLYGDKVVLDEKITVNERIRDFIVDDKGFIILALDSGNLIKLSTYDSVRK